MKKISTNTRIIFLLCLSLAKAADAQNKSNGPSYQKNAFTFNLGQYMINELNLGYEHFFTEKKSVEICAGVIYRNQLWLNMAEEWSNSQYFYEHGFGLKASHRIYRKGDGKSEKKTYYSFGLNYQYLYFKDEWFTTDHEPVVYLKNDTGLVIDEELGTEEIYQRRFRNRIGIQFVSGNIFPLTKTVAIEIFYGIGLRGIFSNRYDIAVSETGFGKTTVYASGNRDQKFYFRPTVHAGIKLRIGW